MVFKYKHGNEFQQTRRSTYQLKQLAEELGVSYTRIESPLKGSSEISPRRWL